MSPVYSHVTFAQAKQQLANRLYDTTKQFWNDAELGVYITEALRTWNALTAYWRNDFVFPAQQNVTWYDLTNTATMPATLRPYTMTDADLYTAIQYHLLEPAVLINPWTGASLQFSADDVVNAVQRRRDELLSVTGCTITRRLIQAIAGRTLLPDTVIDVRRLAYLLDVQKTWNASETNAFIFNPVLRSVYGKPPSGPVGYQGAVVSVLNAPTIGPNQFAECTIVKRQPGFGPNNHTIGPAVRMTIDPATGLISCYALETRYDGGFQFIWQQNVPPGQFFSIVTDVVMRDNLAPPRFDISGTPGDVLRIEATGNQITGKRNGTIIFGPITDNRLTGGSPGLEGYPENTPVAFMIQVSDFHAGPLPSGAIQVPSLDAIGDATPCGVGRVAVPLFAEDVWGEQSFNRGYLQQPAGTPSTYLLSTEPPISFDVDAAPNAGANYELLTVEAGLPLTGVLTGTTITDNFNRPNENPLASPWSVVASYNAPQLKNNAVVLLGTAPQVNVALYSGVLWQADQAARFVIKQLKPTAGYLGVVLRCDPGGFNFYYVSLNASPGFGGIGIPTPVNLQKIVNGVLQGPPYFGFANVIPQVGDVLQAQITGNTITVTYNGVPLGSFTDTTSPILVGSPGILLQSAAGATDVADVSLDDWQGTGTFSTLLSVPDDWTHVIKWGALADLLSRESNAKDSLRASYCEQRYRMGLALLSSAPALLAMRVGNVPLQIDSVRAADLYQTSWQAAAPGTPAVALHAGLNKLALSPATSVGPYSLTATVVQNAPVPKADGDLLQVARDDLDVVLDYAQHLAAFKMGGQEFLATIPLLQRFMKKAEVYGLKLAELGEYTSIIYALSSREDQMNPRMVPSPEAADG